MSAAGTAGGAEFGPLRVGEPFPLEDQDAGDCPAIYRGPFGWPAPCVLDTGHAGPHLASDGHVVVEVWP